LVGSRGFEPETIGYISRVSPFLKELKFSRSIEVVLIHDV